MSETLSSDRIARLVQPYLFGVTPPPELYSQLSSFLDLLLKWNARTNLTAIRDPEEIVRRHFGESLFVGAHLQHLPVPSASLLDFGSGAGFPGLPIQLLHPTLSVILAESQNKKATFLREATRTLSLKTQVWAERVESMPSTQLFDHVTMRAVDKMETALAEAHRRVTPGGYLSALCGRDLFPSSPEAQIFPVPENKESFLYILKL